MNTKTPLAIASAALLTLAFGGCAHTEGQGMDTASSSMATADIGSAAAAGTAGVAGTAGTAATVGPAGTATTAGTAGASGTTGIMGASGASGTAGATGTTGMAGADPAASGATGGQLVINSAAEALALTAAVDQMEIMLSQQAKSRKVPAPVMEYANMMIQQHTAHLAQARKLLEGAGAATADSPTVQKLMAAAKVTHDRLGALQGDAYARAYVEQMVASHQHALTMVDAAMPMATDAAVRDFMTTTRQALQMHLEHAQRLQGQLRG